MYRILSEPIRELYIWGRFVHLRPIPYIWGRFCTFEAEIIYFVMWCLWANQRAVSVHLRPRENRPQMYRSASNVRICLKCTVAQGLYWAGECNRPWNQRDWLERCNSGPRIGRVRSASNVRTGWGSAIGHEISKTGPRIGHTLRPVESDRASNVQRISLKCTENQPQMYREIGLKCTDQQISNFFICL